MRKGRENMKSFVHIARRGDASGVSARRDMRIRRTGLGPRPAVILCPGGGYAFTSPREADPPAFLFLNMGLQVLFCIIAWGSRPANCSRWKIWRAASFWYVSGAASGKLTLTAWRSWGFLPGRIWRAAWGSIGMMRAGAPLRSERGAPASPGRHDSGLSGHYSRHVCAPEKHRTGQCGQRPAAEILEPGNAGE